MRALSVLLLPGILVGQGYVYNTAGTNSYASPAQLAQGSLATIAQYSSALLAVAPGTLTATVSVRPVGASMPVSAQVLSATSDQITFVVTSTVPLGPAQLIFKASNDTTKWLEINVVSSGFGISATQIVAATGTVRQNSLSKPAQPGETVVLWGSGLGTAPSPNPTVTFGGVRQNILYAGNAPGLIGVNQINFQVSAAVPDGCYVPVTVSTGQGTAVTYLSKSGGGAPCPHPLNLSADDLAALDAGKQIDLGTISTFSNIVAVSADHASRQENAAVSFVSLDSANLMGFFTGGGWISSNGSIPAVGSQALGRPGAAAFDVSAPVSFTANDSPVAGLPAAQLAGGPWTWSNSGGPSVAASSFPFSLPPPILLKGDIPLALSSAHDQTISWNPAGYDSTAILQASLSRSTAFASRVGDFAFPSTLGLILANPFFPIAPANLSVSAPAASGILTIPAAMLGQLGPGAATLTVQVSEPLAHAPSIVFRETSGKALAMLVSASTSESLPVDIQ